ATDRRISLSFFILSPHVGDATFAPRVETTPAKMKFQLTFLWARLFSRVRSQVAVSKAKPKWSFENGCCRPQSGKKPRARAPRDIRDRQAQGRIHDPRRRPAGRPFRRARCSRHPQGWKRKRGSSRQAHLERQGR